MKRRLIGCGLVVAAAALAFAYAAQGQLDAQGATPAAKQDPASKPTPHLADGHPDLNGTYFHDGGVSFIRPRKLADGSICFFGCPPGKGGPPPKGEVQGPPIPPPAPSFPKYKQEFLAKVKDLNERQVQTDTMLRCMPPGVPRIGPDRKSVV